MTVPPFHVLLEATREPVLRFLVAMVGRADADDCFQETYLAALRAYPRVRDAANLRSWVFTIAHRKALDSLRASRRRPDPVADVPEAATVAPSPDEADVWDAVDGLPSKQRAAVVLRYRIGLPYREIARVLGSSEPAARQNVREAKRRLKGVLG